MTAAALRYDDFQIQGVLGEHTETYDPQLAQRWRAVFSTAAAPADGPGWEAAEAPGIAVALLMRSYMVVTARRPPGNIHARQQLQFTALPAPGESVRTRILCAGKEMRRERRYVELEAVATGAGDRPLFRGRMTIVWAA